MWAKMKQPGKMEFTVIPHFSGIGLFQGIKQA
jgi:hypothetical protein